ncbi:MAG TPA: anion permease [Vicinamibacterales bacterium]|jgi:di/tricarboxylate transporter
MTDIAHVRRNQETPIVAGGTHAFLRWLPWRVLLPVAVGVGVALVPAPSGLTLSAWRYFALFAAVAVGLVVEPVPAAGVGFIGMAAAVRLTAYDI